LGNTTFEAFGSDGNNLGTIVPGDVSDALITGETAEDTFFGWVELGGMRTGIDPIHTFNWSIHLDQARQRKMLCGG